MASKPSAKRGISFKNTKTAIRIDQDAHLTAKWTLEPQETGIFTAENVLDVFSLMWTGRDEKDKILFSAASSFTLRDEEPKRRTN